MSLKIAEQNDDDCDGLEDAIRSDLVAVMLLRAFELVARVHPERLRKSLGAAFDTAAIEDILRTVDSRVAAMLARVDAANQEAIASAGVLNDVVTDLENRANRLDARLDKAGRTVNELARRQTKAARTMDDLARRQAEIAKRASTKGGHTDAGTESEDRGKNPHRG